MPNNSIKIFFDSNVILGAAQLRLLEESQLSYYMNLGLLKKPQTFVFANESLTKLKKLLNEKELIEIEPYVSRKVRVEVQSILKSVLEKILNPLRVQDEISKMSIEDRKIFERFIYQIFIIKLPLYVNEIVDDFSSMRVDKEECEMIRDDIFNNIYRPLLPRFKNLIEKFEISGIPNPERERDHAEYSCMKLNLRSFRDSKSLIKFINYKTITDLLILAEAIYSYQKLANDLRNLPEFYFVSNDTIFISVSQESLVFDKIPKLINQKYKINVLDSKHMSEYLSRYFR